VEVLPPAVRVGRDPPLGAAPPQQVRALGQRLERTQICEATPPEWPPQLARWARPSQTQERAGITGQLRRRAG
jgi:hypothetical protein